MTDKIQKAPKWLEPQYRFVAQYVDYPEDFEHTETMCLFTVRENAPLPIRHLVAAYDCYWCFDETKSLKLKDERYAIGINEDADDDDREEGKILWKMIQRGDLPADLWQWGEFELRTHAEVDEAYPGWRDVARLELEDDGDN